MKTQIDIQPESLHRDAKVYAARNGVTLAALVNEGLATLLRRKQPAAKNPGRKA